MSQTICSMCNNFHDFILLFLKSLKLLKNIGLNVNSKTLYFEFKVKNSCI